MDGISGDGCEFGHELFGFITIDLSTNTNRGKECYNKTMQDAKEEVRARLAIEDIVGEYVQLKRAGRNFKGLSPFTSEKTPSFVVSPDKNIWHDFSSGRGGDVFSFVMEVAWRSPGQAGAQDPAHLKPTAPRQPGPLP